MKSYVKKQKQSMSSSSDVPQLGAQKNQTVEPVIVEQTMKQQDLITFLKESNLTVAQVAGGEDIPGSPDGSFSWAHLLSPPKSCLDANENAKATRPIHDHDVPVRLHEWRED